MADVGVSLGTSSGSNATDRLRQTIQEFTDASSRQTRRLVQPTWVIAILTFVMTVGIGVQIWLALGA
jgi:hypothetical protein